MQLDLTSTLPGAKIIVFYFTERISQYVGDENNTEIVFFFQITPNFAA